MLLVYWWKKEVENMKKYEENLKEIWRNMKGEKIWRKSPLRKNLFWECEVNSFLDVNPLGEESWRRLVDRENSWRTLTLKKKNKKKTHSWRKTACCKNLSKYPLPEYSLENLMKTTLFRLFDTFFSPPLRTSFRFRVFLHWLSQRHLSCNLWITEIVYQLLFKFTHHIL